MCFVHSDISRRTFIEQISLGAATAAAIAGVGSQLAAASEGVAADRRSPDHRRILEGLAQPLQSGPPGGCHGPRG